MQFGLNIATEEFQKNPQPVARRQKSGDNGFKTLKRPLGHFNALTNLEVGLDGDYCIIIGPAQ
ncbi:MAG: hypothetical protein M3372_03995 [Verrucomicrobiota bacterium]|nr:hypothetical protein [Verrucomicrobiota bacterium]